MFVGHFAVGLAAKRLAPSVSLGMLFLAAQFLPGATAVTPLNFVSYPYSHSLLALLVAWGFWIDRHREPIRRWT